LPFAAFVIGGFVVWRHVRKNGGPERVWAEWKGLGDMMLSNCHICLSRLYAIRIRFYLWGHHDIGRHIYYPIAAIVFLLCFRHGRH
jgi:hypothetical protein